MERSTVSFFRRGLHTGPDVRLVEADGHRCVVKDWRRLSRLRRLLGRFMLRREQSFLSHLSDVAGVPRVYGFVDADALAIEYLDGTTISRCNPSHIPDFFERLRRLVEQLHERGVAHGDLDQEDNILVLADGAPAVIDFGGAWRRSWFAPLNAYYELLRRHDLQCVSRLRVQFLATASSEPTPALTWWQREILISLRKMQRPRCRERA